MADCQTFVNPVIRLELSPKEALWLRALLQNPLLVDPLDAEDPGDEVIRSSIFTALPTESFLRYLPQ